MNKSVGAVQAAFSSIFFGFIPFFALPLYELGYTSDLTLFYRFFTAAVLMGLFLFAKEKVLQFLSNRFAALCCMGRIISLSPCFCFLP